MKKHRVFVDTEFQGLEISSPELLSIGLVDQDGAEFYREVEPTTELLIGSVDWVVKNVFKHLQGGEVAMPFAQIGRELYTWLAALAPGKKVLLISDAPAADARYVHALLAPTGFPPNTSPRVWPIYPLYEAAWGYFHEASDRIQRRPGFRAHHALDDARGNREAWLEAQRAIKAVIASGKEKRS